MITTRQPVTILVEVAMVLTAAPRLDALVMEMTFRCPELREMEEHRAVNFIKKRLALDRVSAEAIDQFVPRYLAVRNAKTLPAPVPQVAAPAPVPVVVQEPFEPETRTPTELRKVGEL